MNIVYRSFIQKYRVSTPIQITSILYLYRYFFFFFYPTYRFKAGGHKYHLCDIDLTSILLSVHVTEQQLLLTYTVLTLHLPPINEPSFALLSPFADCGVEFV